MERPGEEDEEPAAEEGDALASLIRRQHKEKRELQGEQTRERGSVPLVRRELLGLGWHGGTPGRARWRSIPGLLVPCIACTAFTYRAWCSGGVRLGCRRPSLESPACHGSSLDGLGAGARFLSLADLIARLGR